MALSIDRRAFIDIISEGQGDVGGVMQPLPEGLWGIPEEVLKTLPGYAPDVQKNRAEAHEIMRNLGYGPDRRLQLKVSTRNIPPYRDPAVLLTDQLKEVFVDGELEIVETASWFPKVAQGLHDRRQSHRRRRRRSRPATVRELRLRFAAQL
jgi:peptide/nickel transport system substrate-binding protein